MAVNFGVYPVIFNPELLTGGYAAGDILFTPEKVYNINQVGNQISVIRQIGIFWDMASAPEIDLYLFNNNPETWGVAGDPPAPSFADRSKLIAEWNVDSSSDQGYDRMLGANGADNSYSLVSGPLLGALNSLDDEVGYLTATVRSAVSVDLTDMLTLTFMVEFYP